MVENSGGLSIIGWMIHSLAQMLPHRTNTTFTFALPRLHTKSHQEARYNPQTTITKYAIFFSLLPTVFVDTSRDYYSGSNTRHS